MKVKCLWRQSVLLFLFLSSLSAFAEVVVENSHYRLIFDDHGRAVNLIHKKSGQECLEEDALLPAFSVMQYRPYDNEVQLTFVTRPTTFNADTLFRKADTLFVGFDRLDYIAVINLTITDDYIGFFLDRFLEKEKNMGIKQETRIDETVFLQLPVKDRRHFGSWLNVSWDEQVAVNLLASDAYTRVDDVAGTGCHVMRAGSVRDVRLTGVGAVLIVSETKQLLDRIDRVEQDYGLPRGVAARRHPDYQMSYYECRKVTPQNVDEHIRYAKMGGFRMMVIYYPDFAASMGHFPWRPEYPNGMEELKEVAGKIIRAGLIPGFHIHYNKAQINDPYVTPVPDPRLNLRKLFTLSESINARAKSIPVEQNPQGLTLHDGRRLLKVGDEIIEYTGYTTERPFRFVGCTRGALHTQSSDYEKGFLFGLLDVDSWPIFIRFNQQTSIQDEVAERIAGFVQEAGFRFIYFDGAEDANRPYWFNVGLAQMRVYATLASKPMFAEGACKTHFNWHILSRGNAFDIFPPEQIKDAVDDIELRAARFNADNFTAMDFGWIGYRLPGKESVGLQPDMVDYIASHAVGWDSPLSLIGELDKFKTHPRTPDNLEIFKRWEDARLSGFFTGAQKEELKKPGKEHILLVDEKGEYELHPCRRIRHAAGDSPDIRAFVFARQGKTWAAFWHTRGAGSLMFSDKNLRVDLYRRPGVRGHIDKTPEGLFISMAGRQYLAFDATEAEVILLFQHAMVETSK